MKGLELARRYFEACGRPMLAGSFPQLQGRVAAGLAGDGSECFGFDDELSRDHDWGPGFCLWLTAEDYAARGADLARAYDRLPASFAGFGPRHTTAPTDERVGVFEIGAFYRRFLGLERPPRTNREWLALPEPGLAAATNGAVFMDEAGEFSRFRQHLLDDYPEDVRRHKLAVRCMSLTQSGQYNLPRSVRRGEWFAARYAETRFCADAIMLVFLLNRRYCPFYKWMHRAVADLPRLGEETHARVTTMVTATEWQEKIRIMEILSAELAGELRRQGLSDSASPWLMDHGPVIQAAITDPEIRQRGLWKF